MNSRFNYGLSVIVAGLILAAAVASECAGYGAKLLYRAAQVEQNNPDSDIPLELVERALGLDPNHSDALYLQYALFKIEGHEGKLNAAIPRMLLVHRNQANVRRLAGERAYKRGEYRLATEFLWEALWINPLPPDARGTWWRMAMVASERSGRPGLALKAAIRSLGIMDMDQTLTAEDRTNLLLDTADLFERQNKSATAEHLRAVAEELEK